MIEKIFDLTIENLSQFASEFVIPKKLNKEDLETFILKVNSHKPLMITLKANFEPSVLGLNFDKEKELFTVDHKMQKN
ncbi:MAG: hypothetical protein CME68_05430 [Halobacteriovoraceae bacterium]|nr:hypothetical protein [Halobacteriovoraceae bacterium]|tara:strand:- start:2022 stop:2255 length:234 start_codon:yes stop_codon:yes gene_type:complete